MKKMKKKKANRKTGYDLWDGGRCTEPLCFLCSQAPLGMMVAKIKWQQTMKKFCYGLCKKHLNKQYQSFAKVEELACAKWDQMNLVPTVVINGEEYVVTDYEAHNHNPKKTHADSYVFTTRDPYVGYLVHQQESVGEIEEELSEWIHQGRSEDLSCSPGIIRTAYCHPHEKEKIKNLLELGYVVNAEENEVVFLEKFESRKISEETPLTEEMIIFKNASWTVISHKETREHIKKILRDETLHHLLPGIPKQSIEFIGYNPQELYLVLFWEFTENLSPKRQEDINRLLCEKYNGDPLWTSPFVKFPPPVVEYIHQHTLIR